MVCDMCFGVVGFGFWFGRCADVGCGAAVLFMASWRVCIPVRLS